MTKVRRQDVLRTPQTQYRPGAGAWALSVQYCSTSTSVVKFHEYIGKWRGSTQPENMFPDSAREMGLVRAASSEAHHDYHLVDPSPWPIVGLAGRLHHAAVRRRVLDEQGLYRLLPSAGERPGPGSSLIGLALVLYTMAGWWRDVIRESVVLGNHTPVVKLHLRYGMLLFIASEVMFFVAWFWAYFNSAGRSSFSAMISASAAGRPPASPSPSILWHFPLLNTMILLTSGTTGDLGASRHPDRRPQGAPSRACSISRAAGHASFTCVQAYEYAHAPFTFELQPTLALVPFTDAAYMPASPPVGRGEFRRHLWLDLLHAANRR